MSATDGNEQSRPSLSPSSSASPEELVAIARQVAESMGIGQTKGASTRIAGCQGCGQCLAHSASAAGASSSPNAARTEITEAELVQLVQDVIAEVLQELRLRSVPRMPFAG